MMEAVLALLGAIGSEAWAWIGGTVMAVAGAWWWRRDARRSERNQVAVEAAAKHDERRRDGDAAAADAQRDGASARLRDGRF